MSERTVSASRANRRVVVHIDDIVGTEEIRERLGLRRVQVIHTWIKRGQFACPIKTLGGPERQYRLWAWPDVLEWWGKYREQRMSGMLVTREKR